MEISGIVRVELIALREIVIKPWILATIHKLAQQLKQMDIIKILVYRGP